MMSDYVISMTKELLVDKKIVVYILQTMNNIKHYIQLGWKNLTIEPVIFFYLTSVGLISVIRPNLLIDKACRIKLNFTEEICDNLNDVKLNETESEELIEVQKVVADYERTLLLAATVPRVAFTLLAGPWSDRHGRKLLILIPILGQALTCITFIINVGFFDLLPFEALYMEYINELSGNFVVYYLGEYSYMADITTAHERTARMGVLDGTDYISTMFGTYISGPVFAKFGYFTVFVSSLVFALFGSTYMIFIVKESKPNKSKQTTDKKDDRTVYGTENMVHDVDEVMELEPKSNYCTWADIIGCIKTVFKPRPNNKRLLIWLLLFNFGCYNFAYNGTEGTHRYLFVQKQYDWNEQEYTVFLAAYKTCYLFALWILLPLCSRYFKLHDATILIIACITGSVGWTLPAIINGDVFFILGFVIAMFTPVGTIATRSMISRCVNEDEVGSILALIAVLSAISSSLIAAAYQAIYAGTIETFPAAFLLINSSMLILTIPNNLILKKKLA